MCVGVWAGAMAMKLAGANNQHDSLDLLAPGTFCIKNQQTARNRLESIIHAHLFLFIIHVYNPKIIGKRLGGFVATARPTMAICGARLHRNWSVNADAILAMGFCDV